MNVYDSDKMKDIFLSHNINQTDDFQNADYVVLNTCHIREKATEKTFSDLGKIHKKGKEDQKVIVAGCVAQAEGELIQKRAPYVDLVIGPQSIQSLNKFLDKNNLPKTSITEFDVNEKFDTLNHIKTNTSNKSAFVTIQEGCDKFCHFCVVPYTRGPEYSRPFNEIVNEARIVAAYNNENYKLSNLILEIEKIPEILRIRYTTSHPIDMSDDLIDLYGTSKKLMPLVHLPVQSGSNKILKLMNRNHNIEYYLKIYEKIIKKNSSAKFSSDFIIGYPGEEESDFNSTLDLIKKIKFINSFSFIFSPRPGTKASHLPLIDRKLSNERLTIVQKELFNFQKTMNRSLEGNVIEVLVENRVSESAKYFGRTGYMTPVIFDGKDDDVGKLIKVKINSSNQNTLFGETLEISKLRVA